MDNVSGQKGIALLIFVIVISLAAIVYLFRKVPIEYFRLEQTQTTQTSLNRAKQALLDFAVLYEDSNPGEYGFLPCPDTGIDAIVEGGSHGTCGSKQVNTLGLFPWASLETGILKSGSGNCLWYAVSGEYKDAVSTLPDMLNEDSNGAFRVYDAQANLKTGAFAEDRVVAVLYDPSVALSGQARTFDITSQCGLDYTPANYLEGDGVYDNSTLSGAALSIDDVINRGVDTDQLPVPYNDQLVTITRQELWDAITKRRDFMTSADSAMRRLTQALALCIAAYGNNSGNRKLPRPVAVDFAGLDYRLDGNYDDTVAVSYLGRYPHTVDDSDAALGAANAPNDAVPFLFDKGYCDSLVVGGGPNIDLNTGSGAKGYTLWKNWKDHFFYAVSAYYAPTSIADAGAPNCVGTNCIDVGANEYAAVVLYAGSRTGAQLRNEPFAGDVDTKNVLANYIEVNNAVGDGTGNYTPTANDIAFCITDSDPLTVVSCP